MACIKALKEELALATYKRLQVIINIMQFVSKKLKNRAKYCIHCYVVFSKVFLLFRVVSFERINND